MAPPEEYVPYFLDPGRERDRLHEIGRRIPHFLDPIRERDRLRENGRRARIPYFLDSVRERDRLRENGRREERRAIEREMNSKLGQNNPRRAAKRHDQYHKRCRDGCDSGQNTAKVGGPQRVRVVEVSIPVNMNIIIDNMQ